MPQAFTLWLSAAAPERAAAVAERLQTELRSYEVTSEVFLPSHLQGFLADTGPSAAEGAAYVAGLLNPHGVSLLAVLDRSPEGVARPLPENLLHVRLVEEEASAPPDTAEPLAFDPDRAQATVSLASPSACLRRIIELLQSRGWIEQQAKYAYSPEEEDQIASMLDDLGYL